MIRTHHAAGIVLSRSCAKILFAVREPCKINFLLFMVLWKGGGAEVLGAMRVWCGAHALGGQLLYVPGYGANLGRVLTGVLLFFTALSKCVCVLCVCVFVFFVMRQRNAEAGTWTLPSPACALS